MAPFYPIWATVFERFDPDNPLHIALLQADLKSDATSRKTKLMLRHLNSALRRFPPEILAEIFRICVAADMSMDGVLDTWTAPWVLGQICRSWRTVALSTPRLWCYIDIVLEHPDESHSKNMVRLLKLFLERSRSCPLTLRVDSGSRCTLDLRSHPVLNVLMKTSDRWGDAHFCLPPFLLVSLSPIKGRLGSLRTLTIFPNLGLSQYHPNQVIDAFQIAPLLDTAQVSLECAITVHLPSEQITHYRSTCDSLPDLSRILYSMQNLVVCHIEPALVLVLYPVPKPIRLPNLRILQIANDRDDDSGVASYRAGYRAAFLDAFNVPGLTIVKISCHKDDQFFIPNLIAMVDRSSCTLQKVSLEMPAEIPLDILQFLQYTPKLTNLTLKGTHLMPGVAQGLTRVADSIPGLLPTLQTLVIDADFSDSEIVDMARSRTDPNLALDGASDDCFLDKLRIKRQSRIDDAAFDSLLRGMGLTVGAPNERDEIDTAYPCSTWKAQET
ncbi:hypothetical protein B0H12DRAFT_82827 [Mycena haematopus]|nr:hypothetical protein B0H12DRAFT_82827 [Mycena haematopus]